VRLALFTAALASILYLGMWALYDRLDPHFAFNLAVQVLMFFGIGWLVGELVRRQAARQHRRDEEVDATRTALDIQHMINTAYDTDVTLDLVILKQRELLKCHSYAVLLAENNVLRVRVASGLPNESRTVRLGVNEEDHGWAAGDGRPLIIADTSGVDTRFAEIDPAARSILAVPLHSVERLVGLLFFGSREADGFSPESIDRAEEFANRIVFPIQRALLEEELRRLAFTDAQTSLFNHRHFQTLLDEEIRRAQRYGRPLSIIFLDLDSFKAFNDTYGHPAGDTLLREVSGVLRANLRAVDMAARYGGEEFVVILPETAGEQAAVLAERLREAVEQMEVCVEEGRVPHVTVSVGVASFPANAQTKSELIEAADKAQYEAKTSGKNRVVQSGS
jgi:diguanylate cyclase (GGDEF)-like protein